ncbi:MAG: Flagellar biosynthetic protein FliQ [Syntrophorhabdaceae bacterium PtaU1.Bin034]|jgi:flagellar biosynthetic protein FliQ|nr:MAG: Flagellar biosynthetic protein FliQ [Syntrophorhabdaceae bacterium PtaU1.Bin034]
MSQDLVIQIFRDCLKTALLVAAPMLIAALIVGLAISIFQAATQIHEMSLAFVPKILAIIGCLMILSPWILNVLVTFTRNLITNIPVYVR